MAERDVVIRIVGEDKASPAIKKVDDSAAKLQKTTKGAASENDKLAKGLGGALPGAAGKATSALQGAADGAGGMGLAAVGAAVAATKLAFDFAQSSSALNEQLNGTKTIFGDAAAEVTKFGEDAGMAIGLSETAGTQGRQPVRRLVHRHRPVRPGRRSGQRERRPASPATSHRFKDVAPEEALQKLQAGLNGEAEPLRAFGIFLDEASTKAKGMELGLANANGELSNGDKVLARYQLILESTKDAQGDFAKTSDSLANKQRQLAAEAENTKAALGASLTPTLAAAEGGVLKLLNATDSLTGKNGGGGFKELVKFGLAGPVTAGLVRLGDSAGGAAAKAQSLEVATSRYAKVVVDGKKDTDEGRRALKDFQDQAAAAETTTQALDTALKSEKQQAEEQAKATRDAAARRRSTPTPSTRHVTACSRWRRRTTRSSMRTGGPWMPPSR